MECAGEWLFTGEEGIIMSKLILITGASGSGKTFILKEIEKRLECENFSINYFDHIVVPSFENMVSEYGSCEGWQEAMTHKWIDKLIVIKNKKYIFLEGSFNPEFAVNYLNKLNIIDYKLFCINVSREIREERLIKNRNQPELATQDMENFGQFLKAKTIELGGKIVESNEGACDQILNLCYSHQDIIDNNHLLESVKRLELSLLDPSVRQSTEQLNELIVDDFVEFGSSGKIWYKQDCLELEENYRKFCVTDFEIKKLSIDVILATYKTTENLITTLRSSIWKKYDDRWRICFHQGTKVQEVE